MQVEGPREIAGKLVANGNEQTSSLCLPELSVCECGAGLDFVPFFNSGSGLFVRSRRNSATEFILKIGSLCFCFI